jgi:hypothetical protein
MYLFFDKMIVINCLIFHLHRLIDQIEIGICPLDSCFAAIYRQSVIIFCLTSIFGNKGNSAHYYYHYWNPMTSIRWVDSTRMLMSIYRDTACYCIRIGNCFKAAVFKRAHTHLINQQMKNITLFCRYSLSNLIINFRPKYANFDLK